MQDLQNKAPALWRREGHPQKSLTLPEGGGLSSRACSISWHCRRLARSTEILGKVNTQFTFPVTATTVHPSPQVPSPASTCPLLGHAHAESVRTQVYFQNINREQPKVGYSEREKRREKDTSLIWSLLQISKGWRLIFYLYYLLVLVSQGRRWSQDLSILGVTLATWRELFPHIRIWWLSAPRVFVGDIHLVVGDACADVCQLPPGQSIQTSKPLRFTKRQKPMLEFILSEALILKLKFNL